MLTEARKFSIAPMMDWTDKHCRYFHRVLTKRALLFTEMVTSAAIVHGDQECLLGFASAEHPVAVQLGGSDPEQLAAASKICAQFGYDEINLNVGCPSDRVQSGRFGACLMAEPALVADCVQAMVEASEVPVTVKCRIGIDDQDIELDLDRFVDAILPTGVEAFYVHARKAWLQGLSPKENRDIPPLDYDRVHRLKERISPFPIYLNGGLQSVSHGLENLSGLDGFMLGRAAYQNPRVLLDVDRLVFGVRGEPASDTFVRDEMIAYADRHLTAGGRLNHITRHMVGFANGLPGARRYRQILSVDSVAEGAGPEVISRAFEAIEQAASESGHAA